MSGIQLSLFEEKTDQEKVREWLLERHEHTQRFWKRDISFEEFLKSRFTGWEGGSCDVDGYSFYSFTPSKLELARNVDDKRLTMTKRQVFALFGLTIKT